MTGDLKISNASVSDAKNIIALVNSAYRGESAKRGWTYESDLIAGEIRINEELFAEIIDDKDAVILKISDDDHSIIGCVYLKKQKENLYLGMLTVSPDLQGAGIGKQLLKASEEYAKQVGCNSILMNVITVRKELLNWYEKHGYEKTDQFIPFPKDKRFGTPKQPLEFVILKKPIM